MGVGVGIGIGLGTGEREKAQSDLGLSDCSDKTRKSAAAGSNRRQIKL